MKNTIKKGVFHFRVFKWRGRYIGICKEAGFVEENVDFETVKLRLGKSAELLLRVVAKNQHLEPSLNTRPPLKYLIYYHVCPLLAVLEFFKDREKESSGFYSFRTELSHA